MLAAQILIVLFTVSGMQLLPTTGRTTDPTNENYDSFEEEWARKAATTSSPNTPTERTIEKDIVEYIYFDEHQARDTVEEVDSFEAATTSPHTTTKTTTTTPISITDSSKNDEIFVEQWAHDAFIENPKEVHE